ncbi:unnamed protein product [Acanthoscelides obtectus]|uniref:Uncharacterized protein n=1 Tax=Acanthoscelides obtectus TaxID=200917 RepID=A0A9P0Q3D9_ACAOB|nr:unnamed protein product [Acanthoscelides obtectus]CAK1658389.1 hypothetical protein AOBTE_LOCUS20852 [Acanthoscelides obtectus]
MSVDGDIQIADKNEHLEDTSETHTDNEDKQNELKEINKLKDESESESAVKLGSDKEDSPMQIDEKVAPDVNIDSMVYQNEKSMENSDTNTDRTFNESDASLENYHSAENAADEKQGIKNEVCEKRETADTDQVQKNSTADLKFKIVDQKMLWRIKLLKMKNSKTL